MDVELAVVVRVDAVVDAEELAVVRVGDVAVDATDARAGDLAVVELYVEHTSTQYNPGLKSELI